MEPFRPLFMILVGGAVYFGTAIALPAAGVDQDFIVIPASIFAAFMALWPLASPVMQRPDRRYTFKNWIAYQLTVAVVATIVMYAVHLYSLNAAKIAE